ncbi:hypothetical protein [Geothrix sp.]|jgi:hypothetical protein|uniref:hypothetical protein n=1 Tax=Geothrix sp. TaxID=1962974 RepID=UPI0025BA9C10|nr:hypothetical protein [Geothrix sp.]
MHAAWKVLVPTALVFSLACQPRAAAPVYAPWEEGLTLAFEDPSLPQPQRSQDRLQVRVARSSVSPGAPRLVQLDLTSLRGQLSFVARHQDGGITLLGEDGRALAQTLPPGFPQTAAWEDRGTQFRVIGRAAWDGAAILPATAATVGVWVEARPLQGPRHRTLYLPNLGEVESQEERAGTWVTVNRLVARGFVDLPASPRP